MNFWFLVSGFWLSLLQKVFPFGKFLYQYQASSNQPLFQAAKVGVRV
jgi:hypothetical protein